MRHLILTIAALLTTLVSQAQTLNVTVGSVTDQYPAAQTGEMTYTGGTLLTILNKTYTLSDITKMYTDETAVSDNTVNVSYNGDAALVYVAGNIAQYVTATVTGAHVSIVQSSSVDDAVGEITYSLSGSSDDGEFYIEGSYKSTIELRGLTLTNPAGAAINIQNGKRIELSVKKDTENTLTDGSGSQKAALYCKGHLELKGKGVLNVYGNYAHAIKSGEYMSVKNCTVNILSAVKDGISCNEYFLMESGIVNINGVGDDGLQVDIDGTTSTGETADHEDEDSGNIYLEGGTLAINVTADAAKGIKAEGDIRISGGTVTANTKGGGVWDTDDQKTKASAGLSADGNITISGGTYNSTNTGAGGKGINADGTLSITGGTINVSTSGGMVYYNGSTLYNNYSGNIGDNVSSDRKSSPKGIKVDGAITISGGVTNVTTTGKGGEGIESKTSITISDGQVYVSAYDDAINASTTTVNNQTTSGDLTISGGYVYARSTNNDGIDSNGNCYIKGGLVYAVGSGAPEVAIDANSEEQKKLYVTGGTIIAIGGLENGSQLTQSCYSASSWNKNTWYSMSYGNEVIAFKTPSSGGTTMVVSASSQPTLLSGVNVEGGTELFNGLLIMDGTVSGGTNVTINSYTGGDGPGGGGPGGGGPGGGGPGGGGPGGGGPGGW